MKLWFGDNASFDRCIPAGKGKGVHSLSIWSIRDLLPGQMLTSSSSWLHIELLTAALHVGPVACVLSPSIVPVPRRCMLPVIGILQENAEVQLDLEGKSAPPR